MILCKIWIKLLVIHLLKCYVCTILNLNSTSVLSTLKSDLSNLLLIALLRLWIWIFIWILHPNWILNPDSVSSTSKLGLSHLLWIILQKKSKSNFCIPESVHSPLQMKSTDEIMNLNWDLNSVSKLNSESEFWFCFFWLKIRSVYYLSIMNRTAEITNPNLHLSSVS